MQLDDQHIVHWDGEESPTVRPDVPQMLEGARQQTLEDEVRWNSRRYTSITSNFSADWWSFPHVSGHALLTSTGTFSDGSPSGLWWVEDAFDWDTASTYRLEFPDGAEELRLLEISARRSSIESRGAKTAAAEFASIIAGWNPDQTYWFSARLAINGSSQMRV